MNAIQYALNNIRHRIPHEILSMVFSGPQTQSRFDRFQPSPDHSSIDYNIRDVVIEKRVNVDCNLVSGTQVPIVLSDVPHEQVDNFTRVYRIPYDKTEGRKITSAQTLYYLGSYGAGFIHGNAAGGDLMSSARKMADTVRSLPIVTTANIQIIGDNVIVVRDNVHTLNDDMVVTCIVEHDYDMNNISPGLYPLYAQLVEYATKNFVYINKNIALDEGYMRAGHELGKIQQTIEDYREAEEEYRRVLDEQWRSAAFCNDRPRMHDYVRRLVGPGM